MTATLHLASDNSPSREFTPADLDFLQGCLRAAAAARSCQDTESGLALVTETSEGLILRAARP